MSWSITEIPILDPDSVGYYMLQQDKPWFEEDCYKPLDKRKSAKF
jgi:hypothetical protein